MSSPIVTVLIPTYNAEQYLFESISSVLNQTIADIEILIVDDGSQDDTIQIINSFNDDRIKLVDGPRKGIAAALNYGISLAKGTYIARMDADDICLPNRFEMQKKLLEASEDYGLCAGNVQLLGVEWPFWGRDCIKPIQFYTRLLWEMPLAHPCVMWKREKFIEHNLFYDESYKDTEDFEFFSRAIKHVEFVGTEEVLLKYRIHENQATVRATDKGKCNYLKIIKRNFQDRLGVKLSSDDLELFWYESEINQNPYKTLLRAFEPALCSNEYSNEEIYKYIGHMLDKYKSMNYEAKLSRLLLKFRKRFFK